MINKSNIFTLYSSCIPVKGKNRSLIFDIQRNNFILIPNALYEIVINFQGKTIQHIKSKYDHNDQETIEEYFQLLDDNEMILWLNDPNEIKRFPKMPLEWKVPVSITNALIDIDNTHNHNFSTISKQLETLGCIALQLRVYDHIKLKDLQEIVACFDKSRLRHIDLLLKYDSLLNESELISFINNFPRINNLVIHSSPKEESKNKLAYIKTPITSCLQCGEVSTYHFTLNSNLFRESLEFNNCLNKKISIDVKGNIKNCPSMPKSFGNINDTTLEEVLNHKDFKNYWNITKDQIDVCKDCEFRHVCTDCRAYTEDPKDKFSKPLKCGYSPYTNKWEEWSTNPLKQKAIKYYDMQELVKKNDA